VNAGEAIKEVDLPKHVSHWTPLTRRSATPRPLIAAITLLLLVLAAALPLFRQTGNRSWNTIWAEDGFEYFQQARRYGGTAVLLRGYSGYLQFPSRALALGSTYLPVHDVSVYLALSASIVGALLAWFTYHVTQGWIGSPFVRVALASMVVLTPVLGAENTANITNIIWVFAAVAPWALVSLAERPLDIVVRSVVAFLAATATSLCFFFLPLAIGWILIRRTRATVVVAGAFVAGLVIQGLVMLHTKDIVSTIPQGFLAFHRSVVHLAEATGLHTFGLLLVGYDGSTSTWLTQHQVLTIGSTIFVVIILAVLMRGAGRDHRLLALVFFGYAIITFVAPVWERNDVAPRYSVMPVIFLASALAVLLADPTRDRGALMTRIGRPLFVVWVVILTIIGFSITTYRSESPTWSNGVTFSYTTKCRGKPPDTLVQVRTDDYNFWPVTLPCRDLVP
jgi:hypothetical protein